MDSNNVENTEEILQNNNLLKVSIEEVNHAKEADETPQTEDLTNTNQLEPDVENKTRVSEAYTYNNNIERCTNHSKTSHTAEASTQINNDVENTNNLPPELRLEALTQYVNTVREGAETFVLIQVKREKSHDGKSEKEHVHFRMEADLKPEWLIHQEEIKRQSEEIKKKALSEIAWPKYTRGKLKVPKKAYSYGSQNKILENIKNKLNATQEVKNDKVAVKKQLPRGDAVPQTKRLVTQGQQKTVLKKPDNSKIDTKKLVKPGDKLQIKAQTGKETKQVNAGRPGAKNIAVSNVAAAKNVTKGGVKSSQATKQNLNVGKSNTKNAAATNLTTKNLKNTPNKTALVKSGTALAGTKNATKPVVKIAIKPGTKAPINTSVKVQSKPAAANKPVSSNTGKGPATSNTKGGPNIKGNDKPAAKSATITKQKTAASGHEKTLGTKATQGKVAAKPAGVAATKSNGKGEKVTVKDKKQPVIKPQSMVNKTALKPQPKSNNKDQQKQINVKDKDQQKQMNVKHEKKQEESKKNIKTQQPTKTNQKEDKSINKKETSKVVIKEPVKPAPTKRIANPTIKSEPPVPKKREEKKVESKLETNKKTESNNKTSNPNETKKISAKPNVSNDGPQKPVENKEEKIVSQISVETQREVETEKNTEIIDKQEAPSELIKEIVQAEVEESESKIKDTAHELINEKNNAEQNETENTKELITENNNTEETTDNNLENNEQELMDELPDTIKRETTNDSPEEHTTHAEEATSAEHVITQVMESPLESVSQGEVESSVEVTVEAINLEVQEQEQTALEKTNVNLAQTLLDPENIESIIPTSNDLSQDNPPVEPTASEEIVADQKYEVMQTPVIEKTRSSPIRKTVKFDLFDHVFSQILINREKNESYKEKEPPKPYLCNKCGFKVTEYIEKDPEKSKKNNDEEEEIIEPEVCQDCGITIIKELPSSNECINCQGVLGCNTKFQLEFDVISKKFVTLCLICKSPLGIMQKTRRRPPVPMLRSRSEMMTPAFDEIVRRWQPARDAVATDSVSQYDPSELYTTSYTNDFKSPPLGPPVRPPPPSEFPKRPRFLHKTAYPQDYKSPPADYKLEGFHGRRKFSGLGYVR